MGTSEGEDFLLGGEERGEREGGGGGGENGGRRWVWERGRGKQTLNKIGGKK